MPIALSAGQNIPERLDKGLPLLRIGPAEQLLGRLPRQLAAVQGCADCLATAKAAEALTYRQHQPLRAAPAASGSSAAPGRLLLGVAWPPSAGRRRRPHEAPLRSSRKGGSAAGAAERESTRPLGVIGVPPTHDGLGMAPGARGHAGGARALRDLVESKGPLTGAGMARAQGHVAQVLRGPTPARIINA